MLRRRFVVLGHRARTDGEFALDDLCGATGRLDILIRCMNSAFMLSHGLRTDTECHLVLLGPPEPPKSLRLVGAELKHLNPDERSTAALLRTALREVTFGPEIAAAPGVYISTRSFAEVIKRLSKHSELFYLSETGADIRQELQKRESRIMNHEPRFLTFILGDDRDLTTDEESVLKAYGARVISIGPLSLHADHCITIVHNELDRWVHP